MKALLSTLVGKIILVEIIIIVVGGVAFGGYVATHSHASESQSQSAQIAEGSSDETEAESAQSEMTETEAESNQAAEADSDALPTDGDRTVLTGTVHVWSTQEVESAFDQTDPNAAYGADGGPYTLIVFDEAQEIYACNGDGQGSRYGNARCVVTSSLGEDAANIAQYDGKHVVFSIDSDATYWPSDTRMPLGEPGTSDINILRVDD